MPEADEHEAGVEPEARVERRPSMHPPPTSSPRIYAVERGHGGETSGEDFDARSSDYPLDFISTSARASFFRRATVSY